MRCVPVAARRPALTPPAKPRFVGCGRTWTFRAGSWERARCVGARVVDDEDLERRAEREAARVQALEARVRVLEAAVARDDHRDPHVAVIGIELVAG
jgi:hypothetical protein